MKSNVDRSQSLFYFVPQENSHSQAGSTSQMEVLFKRCNIRHLSWPLKALPSDSTSYIRNLNNMIYPSWLNKTSFQSSDQCATVPKMLNDTVINTFFRYHIFLILIPVLFRYQIFQIPVPKLFSSTKFFRYRYPL